MNNRYRSALLDEAITDPMASPEPVVAADGLVINLAALIGKPTGHSVVMKNVVARLAEAEPTLLVSDQLDLAWADDPRFTRIPAPSDMTSDEGRAGHLKRLLWTQFALPSRFRQVKGRLLFSPLPEAPIGGKVPSVVTLYDFIPLEVSGRNSMLHRYFLHYVPRVLAEAKAILSISRASADIAVARFGIPADRIEVTPLAHDAAHFRPSGLPTADYVLCLGRCDPYKNVSTAVRALAQLPSSLRPELYLAGPRDPRYTPGLEALARDLNVRLRVLDYVPYAELPRLIEQAIALVFPSRAEGFGLPVLEAMATGTPVIASDTPAVAEVAGGAALLQGPDDVNGFARSIMTLIDDPGTRRDLRAAGLQRATEFNWDRTAEASLGVLRRYL